MKPWSNKAVVAWSPILAGVLIETGGLSQIFRMWSEQSAEGQSLLGWIAVLLALLLWLNFYRVCTPEQKSAFWVTAVGVLVNLGVIGTVLWFRYLH